MAGMTFEWDAEGDPGGNVRHIARHGIAPSEAEHVVRNPRNDVTRSDSSTYPITFGRTRAGKYIAVVWSAIGTDPIKVRVVTAYEVKRPGRES